MVRAAINSQPGVKSYKMSGLRATVFMEDGKSLSEAKLREAFSKTRVRFVSLEEKEQAVPKAAYMLAVSGATCAITNDKARAALEKMNDVAAAYVNNNRIEIHLSEDVNLDEAAVKNALGKYNVKLVEMKKVDV